MLSRNQGVTQSAISLDDFIAKEQAACNLPVALATVLKAIAGASRLVHSAIIKAALDREDRHTAYYNTSGDVQQKLDILAQDVFTTALTATQTICAVISEESESLIRCQATGSYIVALDPLDGSGNLAVNGPVGTLFSVYQRQDVHNEVQESEVLLPGRQQVVAGYILYSTAVTFVYSIAQAVHVFTYNPAVHDFFLTHPHIRMPQTGSTYAINHSYLNNFPHYIQAYVTYCNRQECSSRYTGALVADFHRHLVEGGIYLYPPTRKRPNGKLRLMFECNVLAFVAQQAGGLASNGKQPILDIIPLRLHQCVPFYIGSSTMVQNLLSYIHS